MATVVTILPGRVNYKVYQNDSFVQSVTLTDEAEDPINLSTATILMQVRQTAGSTVLLELTEADGITVSGAGNNIMSLNKVVNIAAGVYSYDLQVTYASGVVQTVIYGSFSVTADITRA